MRQDIEYVLEMQHISKTFPGTKALDDVDFQLKPGEIVSIVGANGAGKSTLIKVICGVYQADSGSIMIDGTPVDIKTPKDALNAGISTIHQELSYHRFLTVAENIFLGVLPLKSGLTRRVDWKKLYEAAEPYLREVGLSCRPDTIMDGLSVADKQLVEIAKALSRKARIIIFDEPTASIGMEETATLLNIIRRLSQKGVSIIYISHRLGEVTQISQRIVCMRDGHKTAELTGADITEENIVKNMIGKNVDNMYPQFTHMRDEIAFEVQNLSTQYLKNISFKARAGEVLGLFGMAGSGRTETFDAICGAVPRTKGEISVYGKKVSIKNPANAIANGIAYLTADRKQNGLILSHGISRNIILASLHKITWRGLVDEKKELQKANEWIKKILIKTSSATIPVRLLSGGNQQKVVIAKCLECDPKILLLNEPTRGVDVGAKAEIYQEIEKLCRQGLCIIMIASELSEIMGMSDRILTFANGKITGEFINKDLSPESLMVASIPRGNEE